MPRIAYVILCSCLLLLAGLLAGPANAGRYDDGYYRDSSYHPRPADRVWYSSSCCYRKIVRHVRKVSYVRYVHYVPVKDAGVKRYHRYHRHGGYDLPRHRVSYSVPPRRYVDDDGYADRRHPCHHRRVRVLGAHGESVWAMTARCY